MHTYIHTQALTLTHTHTHRRALWVVFTRHRATYHHLLVREEHNLAEKMQGVLEEGFHVRAHNGLPPVQRLAMVSKGGTKDGSNMWVIAMG